MLRILCPNVYFQLALFILFLLPIIVAQTSSCKQEKIYRDLQANIDNGSDIFCSQLLEKVSYIGTLREDPTLFFYATVTDTKSKDPVYTARSITTKTKITTTSFESQQRTGTTPVAPLPSYVQQYPTPRVIKACSCIIPTPATYTQYRVCEQESISTTFSSTFTITTGRPGKTITIDIVETKTKLKSTTAPFPTACPGADNVDYIATDHTVWERGCSTGLNQYRELKEVKAPSFLACIEECVEYNTKIGYKQCQAVAWVASFGNLCSLFNEPGYFAHNPGGGADVATLRFAPPTPTYTDYCATVTGADGFGG